MDHLIRRDARGAPAGRAARQRLHVVVVRRPGVGAEEIDAHIARFARAARDTGWMAVLFLPTGPIQEVSLSSGWGDEFVALADRFDRAVLRAPAGDPLLLRCAASEAAHADVRRRRVPPRDVHRHADPARDAGGPRRDRRRRGAARARPRARAVLLPGLPAHLLRRPLEARGRLRGRRFHDSIRGTCPEGHNRMLEDYPEFFCRWAVRVGPAQERFVAGHRKRSKISKVHAGGLAAVPRSRGGVTA